MGAERRRQILERLNTYDVGPTPQDHRIMEEAEREKDRRLGEAADFIWVDAKGGTGGFIWRDLGGRDGDN